MRYTQARRHFYCKILLHKNIMIIIWTSILFLYCTITHKLIVIIFQRNWLFYLMTVYNPVHCWPLDVCLDSVHPADLKQHNLFLYTFLNKNIYDKNPLNHLVVLSPILDVNNKQFFYPGIQYSIEPITIIQGFLKMEFIINATL